MNAKSKITLAAITGAQSSSTCALSAAGKRYFRLAALAAAVAAVLLPVRNTAWGQNFISPLGTPIPIPGTLTNTTAGNMYSFDISWVDQGTHKYYLADRSNAVVDIVDTNTNTLLGQLAATPQFAGFTPCVAPGHGANDCAGPNGVVTGGHCLFVTDAPSRVVSFNTSSFPPTQVSDVKTDPTDPTRADELAFDPTDNIILAINNASTPPFGTLITVNPLTCALSQPDPATNRITFDLAHGVDATNGAEQPQWDPGTRKFYLSIPQIGPEPRFGGVLRISSTGAIEAQYSVLFCSPAGLSVGPNENLLVGCSIVFDEVGGEWNQNDPHTAAPQLVILDAVTGITIANILGVGAGDEVWFNSGDGNYYAASSASPLRPLDVGTGVVPVDAQGATVLGVIDAQAQRVIQQVPTFNVPAAAGVHPASVAHSVAADASNNHIFVPLGANNVFPNCLTGCIAVFSAPSNAFTPGAPSK
jgi:hypothetical protein